jgi:hypothetical protein
VVQSPIVTALRYGGVKATKETSTGVPWAKRAAGSCEGGPGPSGTTLPSCGEQRRSPTKPRRFAAVTGVEVASADSRRSAVAPRGHPLARTFRALERAGEEVGFMQRVLAKDLRSHAGRRVRLAGWLHRQRRLSKVSFVVLRDASGLAQVVVDERRRDVFDGLVEESVFEVTGMAVANDQAPDGVEVVDPSVKVLSTPAERPPLNLYRPVFSDGLPTLLDLAPLALRHPLRRSLFRVAAASQAGFRSALEALRFTEINTPKIVASATESGANVFSIDYFGRPAFLAQSPQFYKQAWSVCSSASSRLPPRFGPSRTTRRAT